MGNYTVAVGVVVVTQLSCYLSMIGSFLIILTYVLWRDIRTSSRQLLVFLSISDFITAMGYAFGSIMNLVESGHDDSSGNSPPWCIAESAIANTAQMMSFFWTLCIAIFLYLTIVKGGIKNIRGYKIAFHIVSWGVPIIIMIVAASNDMLGDDESQTSVGWCWIRVGDSGYGSNEILWMLLVGKGWEILSYFILPVIYLLIKVHIWKTTKNSQESTTIQRDTVAAMVKVNRKLTFIPLVFLLLRIWGTIRFFLFVTHQSVQESHPSLETFLQVMHGIGDTFQGGANCIIFCAFTQSVRRHIIEAFRNHCCVKRAESVPADEETHLIYHRNSIEPLTDVSRSTFRIP